MILFLLFHCTQNPTVPTTATENQPLVNNLDQGQQHPPIPADNPVWEWDAQGFVPDHGWFGEHNWSDVRMRVIGHLSVAYRDLARSYAQEGNFEKAANIYHEMGVLLEKIDTTGSQPAEEIKKIIVNAALRDAKYLQALSERKAPIPEGDFSALRAQYYSLAQQEVSLRRRSTNYKRNCFPT